MEAFWLPTVLNMLEDIPHQCPIIKDLVTSGLVGQVLKGLQLLHLPFGCSETCVSQTRVLFLSLSGSGGGDLSVFNKSLPPVLEDMGRLVYSKGCTRLLVLSLN